MSQDKVNKAFWNSARLASESFRRICESFSERGRSAAMASSLIRDARYWPQERALELCFATGRRFLYLGVPPRVAEEFVEAPSKGRFFNRAIKGHFLCHELASPAAPRSRQAAND